MFRIFEIGEKFLLFIRDDLAPFLTTPHDNFSIPIYNPINEQFEYFIIPWLFGTASIAEYILWGGLLFMIGFRLVKFFTDIIL